VSALTDERDAAFAAAHQALNATRLANAIIRDTFPTLAEQAARMNAYVECLDKEDA
jgi:hypothetical protein